MEEDSDRRYSGNGFVNSTRHRTIPAWLSRGMQCCQSVVSHVMMNARGAGNPGCNVNNDDDSMIYSTRSTQQ
jgi:hypothetical protein